jgi:molecular chaperone GrpE
MPSSHGNDTDDARRREGASSVTNAPEPQAAPAAERRPAEAGVGDQAQQDGPSREQLAADLARAEDRHRRALADLDNYRKRSAREVDRRVAESRETLLRDWLEAVDSVERAVRMATDPTLVEGLRSVLRQMESILSREGVERIGAAGERFDPQRHEAVDVRSSEDLPDLTIVEVPRAGFEVGDHILRPAQVVVSRTPTHAP